MNANKHANAERMALRQVIVGSFMMAIGAINPIDARAANGAGRWVGAANPTRLPRKLHYHIITEM